MSNFFIAVMQVLGTENSGHHDVPPTSETLSVQMTASYERIECFNAHRGAGAITLGSNTGAFTPS